MFQDRDKQFIEVVLGFNDALNARDVEAMMALLTQDSVFENTYPPPSGTRYVGMKAIRAFWEDFFQGSATARIEPEEIFVAGNRCVMRWIYNWTDQEGGRGYIRGVDVYTIQDGLISEKFSYVKG